MTAACLCDRYQRLRCSKDRDVVTWWCQVCLGVVFRRRYTQVIWDRRLS